MGSAFTKWRGEDSGASQGPPTRPCSSMPVNSELRIRPLAHVGTISTFEELSEFQPMLQSYSPITLSRSFCGSTQDPSVAPCETPKTPIECSIPSVNLSTAEPGESTQLVEEDLKSNEEQPLKSVEQRNPSVAVNSEVIESVEEITTHSQLPTFQGFTLKEKKDFLKLFELMLEKAKAQGIDVVGRIFQIANFAAAVLDCHGGFLSIDDLDVHLYVPPGAIPVEQTQQVYIFVTGTSSVDKHSFSTPFVHCGPPDTVFDKDVVLTMPHCVKDTSSCKFSVSKLSSGGSSELSEGLDVKTIVDNDSITFSVNHFCGFVAKASPVDGTILKKSMVACVFIREDSHSDDEVTLRLRLVDDFKVNVQEVKEKERKQGFHLADVESPLTVRKNDLHVVAKISKCSRSWEITEPESCHWNFDRELLWREPTASCAQASPSVMFFAKRCSGSQKVCFNARMTVYQEGSGSCMHFLVDTKQKQQELSLALVPDRETQLMERIEQFLDKTAMPQFANFRPRPSEESNFNQLCDMLDVPHPLGNDWRKLVNLLLKTDSRGCSLSIGSIMAKAGRERRSPTEIVWELFVEKQLGKSREETMDTLKCALNAMNRPDAKFAVDAIEEQLMKWSDDGTGEIQGSCHPFTPDTPNINNTDGNDNSDTESAWARN